LWDSLCQTAISLILKALPTVDNAENLQKMKNVVALFIQSMDVSWRGSVSGEGWISANDRCAELGFHDYYL